MKIHEQRNAMRSATAKTAVDVRSLIGSLQRKMASTYGDGDRSNMVNAETDVIPALWGILHDLECSLECCGIVGCTPDPYNEKHPLSAF
tara:strand:+ start:867 stop:1133 length:267 start_codon:yes stop_codon:yes gene_type:complete